MFQLIQSFHFYFICLSFILNIKCVDIQKAKSIDSRTTQAMILKTSNFGEAFYNLKLLSSQIDVPKVFEGLHKLVDDSYQFKNIEDKTFNYTRDLYNKSIFAYKKLYEIAKTDIEKLQQEKIEKSSYLQSLQEQINQKEKSIKRKKAELEESKKDRDIYKKELVRQIAIIEDLLIQIGDVQIAVNSDLRNSQDLQSKKASITNFIDEKLTFFQTKKVLLTKWKALDIPEEFTNYTINKISERINEFVEQLTQDRSTMLEQDTSKEKDYQEQVTIISSDINYQTKQKAEIMVKYKDQQDTILLIQENIDIRHQDFKSIEDSIKSLEIYWQTEGELYLNRTQEIEESLIFIRQCIKFWNENPYENLIIEEQDQSGETIMAENM